MCNKNQLSLDDAFKLVTTVCFLCGFTSGWDSLGLLTTTASDLFACIPMLKNTLYEYRIQKFTQVYLFLGTFTWRTHKNTFGMWWYQRKQKSVGWTACLVWQHNVVRSKQRRYYQISRRFLARSVEGNQPDSSCSRCVSLADSYCWSCQCCLISYI